MSNYPEPAQAVIDHFKQIDQHEQEMEEQIKYTTLDFIDCAKNNEKVNYSLNRRPFSSHPAELMSENACEEKLKEAYTAWLCGNKEQAFQIFDAVCQKAFFDAVEWVAECYVESTSN